MLRSRRSGALRAVLAISAGACALLLASASAFGAVRKVPQKYPSIQAAVDAANPGDTVAIAKKRNFEHVTVNTARLVIKGVKPGVVVDGYIEGSGPGHQFNINANRVRVVNLEIRHGYGVECNASSRCVANKVRFTGDSGDDCFTSQGDRSQVLNSRMAACGDHGIEITGERARVINTTVRQAAASCIYISGDDAVVRGSSARGCEDGSAIEINGNKALVRGNAFVQADGNLVSVSGNRARVIKNTGANAYAACVDIGGERPRVQGNRMSGCDGGVYLNGQQPKVINNRFGANDGDGVVVSCSIACDQTQVQGNVVRDQYDDAIGFYIYVAPNTGQAVIRDNLAVGSPDSAFDLTIHGGRIIGNVARSSANEHEDAISVSGNGNLVRENRAIGNGGDGFYIGGNDNRLERNVARKNHGDGIYVSTFTGNVLVGNVATRNKADGFDHRGADTALRRNRASANGRDCANDGTIAVKRKNRCADKSNFNKLPTASRLRAKRG